MHKLIEKLYKLKGDPSNYIALEYHNNHTLYKWSAWWHEYLRDMGKIKTSVGYGTSPEKAISGLLKNMKKGAYTTITHD